MWVSENWTTVQVELTVRGLVIFSISWIIYGGSTGIRDDPNLGRVATSSGVNALVNGRDQDAKVQDDGS